MSSPRALLASVDFPPHKDGVSAVSEAVANDLVAQGYSLCVLGPQSPDAKAYDKSQAFKVLRSPLYDWGYLRFLPFSLLFIYALLFWRPRIVFAMNIAYGGLLAYALRFAGYRYYLWAYGYEFHKVRKNYFLRALYRKIYKGAHRVYAISDFVAARLEEFGVPRSKMRIVHPAVDPERFKIITVPRNGERVILSVSRLVQRKGQDQVLRALPQVLKAVGQARYWIAGEGPMRGTLERLVRDMQLQGHVRFLGKVGDQALVELYNRCDVFVMPSKECADSGHVEGWGIVFLEANACGKPVIGGRSGGIPEVIEEGKSGLLVDPENTEELADAMIRLLTDDALAQSLGSYGRKRVEEKLNWSQTLQAMDLH